MNKEHRDSFTESQLPILVQKSAHPAPDTFSILTARNKGAVSGSRYECPLCPFFVEKTKDQNHPDSTLLGAEFPVNEAPKIIQNHIAAHLESIALLSLPEQDALDENLSLAKESEISKKNSTRQDNQGSSSQGLEEEQYFLAIDLDSDKNPSEFVPESIPETTEYTWAYVFDSLDLRQADDFEPAHDVTLRGFVERARYIQMIKSWKLSEIPILIIYDPEGVEIAFHDSKGFGEE